MGVQHERPHDVALPRQRPGVAGWLWRIALLALLLHLLAVSLLACVGRLELVRAERGAALGQSVGDAAAFHTRTVTAPDEVSLVSEPRLRRAPTGKSDLVAPMDRGEIDGHAHRHQPIVGAIAAGGGPW